MTTIVIIVLSLITARLVLVQFLPWCAYLVFCVTVALAAPALGVYTAVPLALGLCLATYAAVLRGQSSIPRAGSS